MPKILDVPVTVFAAVRALLQQADLHREKGDLLDLRDVQLRSKGGAPTTEITVATLYGAKTQTGLVELSMNGEITQMDLDKAREVVGMLQGAIEASISDALMVQFLREKVGLDVEQAGRALLDFREMRQGSKDRVHPS
jgi:hypothetical protein